MFKGIESLVREPSWTRGGDPVFEGWDLTTVAKHQGEIREKLRTLFFSRYDGEAWGENLDFLRRLEYLDGSPVKIYRYEADTQAPPPHPVHYMSHSTLCWCLWAIS